ncbi:Senescence regulator [Fagus crenata]
MASRKIFHAKPSCIYSTSESDNINPVASNNLFEFDEADVWNSNHVSLQETKKTLPTPRQLKKVTRKRDMLGDMTMVASTSLPMNVPDWSKILKDDYKEHRKRDSDEDVDDDDYEDQDNRLPPHEYLARTRGASFSVHEGVGRTLKGMDLRRVRNAIWEKVGFEG